MTESAIDSSLGRMRVAAAERGISRVNIGDSVASVERSRLRGRQVSSPFGDFLIAALSSCKEKNRESARHYNENYCPCEHVVVGEE